MIPGVCVCITEMGWTTSAIQHSKKDGRKDDEFQWGQVLFEVPVRYQSGDAQ